MTEQEAGKALNGILDQLQVISGDCVMLGIDMSKLPLPAYFAAVNKEAFRERENKWCRFVLTILLERLGSRGTLLVPSYSYSCSRSGSIFRSESTRSEVGPFTEFFRQQENVRRSLHPVFSISGTGQHAAEILDVTGYSAFGSLSPFARFSEYDVKFLCLGVEIRNAITYIHHLEQCSGAPHRFSKLFDTQVYSNEQKVAGPWSAYVAFRGMAYTSDISSLQRALIDANALIGCTWNGQLNHVAGIADVDKIGNQLLAESPYAFVDRKLCLKFEDDLPANMQKNNVSQLIIKAEDAAN